MSLWGCSLNVFVIVIVFLMFFFVGQVMFPHRSDQMPRRPKVSKIAPEMEKVMKIAKSQRPPFEGVL